MLKLLTFKRIINAPQAEVYRAFTNPAALRDWFCDAVQTDARPGGRLYFWWNSGFVVTGEYLTLDPFSRVAFTWHGRGEPAMTRVRVSFAENDGKTFVTLKHSGIGTGSKWTKTLGEIEKGWQTALENLQSVVETGIDLRVARTPRLGIFIGEFNRALAEKLNVPTTHGVRIEGTAEDTGARAAGLEKEDVIVKLAGKKIVDVPALGEALRAHRAGDMVQVVFYRGGARQVAAMKLSQRLIPELPESATELANRARQNYVELNAELATMLEGLADTQADQRAAPDAWSIKEMLAHFVACERDFQSWLAELVNGGKHTSGDVDDSLEFRPNAILRLATLVARYPTVGALMQEIKSSQDETLAMLAALPTELIARKHLYRRAAFWMMQFVPTHFREEHFGDLRAAIAAARQK